jgi:hypothetical protein
MGQRAEEATEAEPVIGLARTNTHGIAVKPRYKAVAYCPGCGFKLYVVVYCPGCEDDSEDAVVVLNKHAGPQLSPVASVFVEKLRACPKCGRRLVWETF